MADENGVMVLTEAANGKLTELATELLACGRKLADDLSVKLSAFTAGSGIKEIASEAIAFGADTAYFADNALLKNYHPEAYLAITEKLIKELKPQVVIMGQTDIGRDLAPRLAFRLQTVAVLDCIDLSLNPGSKKILLTKPVYGGNVHAVFTSDLSPQIATVRAKTVKPLPRDSSRKGEIVNFDAAINQSTFRLKLVEKKTQAMEGIRLEEAKVVVSGGRGMGGAEGFRQLEELAALLKGAVAASRPPADSGWVPNVRLVGLTGKVIAPEMYIAVGISGSSQHMAGCSASRNIIAINKDAEANIFRYARYGVVGDWRKVLPAFISKVKELLSS